MYQLPVLALGAKAVVQAACTSACCGHWVQSCVGKYRLHVPVPVAALGAELCLHGPTPLLGVGCKSLAGSNPVGCAINVCMYRLHVPVPVVALGAEVCLHVPIPLLGDECRSLADSNPIGCTANVCNTCLFLAYIKFLMQRHESSPADTKAVLSEWASSMTSLAAAKHQELLGKPMSAVDISNLKAQRNRLTHGWNSDSITGQAAVLIIRQAASYCYDCLATGYGMKVESSILAQKVQQQTDDMVVKLIESSLAKSHAGLYTSSVPWIPT